jgi:hypothetical protein
MSVPPDFVLTLPPSPSRTCVDAGKEQPYRLCFYGGFVRRVTSVPDGSSTGEVLYDQKEAGNAPFVLPAGAVAPWPSSVFELRGGPGNRNVTLQIEDPLRQIDRIEIVLKGPDSDKGVVGYQTGGERIIIEENPQTCPPDC